MEKLIILTAYPLIGFPRLGINYQGLVQQLILRTSVNASWDVNAKTISQQSKTVSTPLLISILKDFNISTVRLMYVGMKSYDLNIIH